MFSQLSRAGGWFLKSGIQEPGGGVARYYRADLGRCHPVSTEITGYAASAFVYLHSLSRETPYFDAALRAARFLARDAWNCGSKALPFELGRPAFAYFFDCGIVVRGLLSAYRMSGEEELLEAAAGLGESMLVDFADGSGALHPILSLPAKQPVERDPLNWSRSSGCYQLKAAMAWQDLAEATGEARFADAYQQSLKCALASYSNFLPGHPDPIKVMDRLHAFLYFLEGMLPRASERRCAAAIADGLLRTERLLREIAPRFERADVYAQLLRMRLYADWTGAAPLDRKAAGFEAETLEGFQAAASDPRIDGGFYFGRRDGEMLPFVNPVSTAFAMQALALWKQCGKGSAQPHRHLLI